MHKPDASRHTTRPAYLRDLLEAAGLSQQQAAHALGVDPRTLRRWLQEPGTEGAAPIPYVAQYCLEALAASGRKRAALERAGYRRPAAR
jgi:transcriptional regulator with XRE-family HTH domain